jgi:competence ComEA-like helix-hairpin-helix protein
MKVLLVFCITATTWAQVLPDGPGKAIVQRMCTPCHGLDNVVRARMTKDRWSKVVDEMVARGATGTDDEIDDVVDYLAAHFGPANTKKVNVNKADAAELAAVLGISAADASAILSYRTQNGPFKSWQDLAKVPAIDIKKIESEQDRVEY